MQWTGRDAGKLSGYPVHNIERIIYYLSATLQFLYTHIIQCVGG